MTLKTLFALCAFQLISTAAFAQNVAFELLPDTKICRDTIAKYDEAIANKRSGEEIHDLSDDVCAACLQPLSEFGHSVMIDAQTSYDDGRTELIQTIKNYIGKKLPIQQILTTFVFPGFPGESETYNARMKMKDEK